MPCGVQQHLVTDKMAGCSLCVVSVFLFLVVGFSDENLVIGLDNGLALTPPSTSIFPILFTECKSL